MKRIYSFDYLKFFAIIGVMVIHTGVFRGVSAGGTDLSFLNFIFETMGRFAVPFFLITAGFMFTVKSEEKGLKKNYTSYIKKVLILYGVWSVIYFVNNIYPSLVWYQQSFADYAKESLSIPDLLYYGKQISEPLWFLPALFFSISITAFAIRFKFLKILLFAALGLNISGLFAAPQMYSFIFNMPIFTRDALFFGFFYTSLGAFMAQGGLYRKIKQSAGFWFAGAGVFLLLNYVEKYLLYTQTDGAGDFYIFTIPMIFCLFTGCLKMPELGNGSVVSRFLTKLGRGALGIYLIHSLIQEWLAGLFWSLKGEEFFSSLFYTLIIIPLMFVLSWLIYYTIPGGIKILFRWIRKQRNRKLAKEDGV